MLALASLLVALAAVAVLVAQRRLAAAPPSLDTLFHGVDDDGVPLSSVPLGQRLEVETFFARRTPWVVANVGVLKLAYARHRRKPQQQPVCVGVTLPLGAAAGRWRITCNELDGRFSAPLIGVLAAVSDAPLFAVRAAARALGYDADADDERH